MKIRMKTTATGPKWTFLAGIEYDISDDVAARFIEGGYADPLEKPRAKPVKIETATEPGPEERAEVRPAPRKRRARRSRKG